MQPKQLEFEEIMKYGLNEHAFPKQASMDAEFERNQLRILRVRNATIRDMLALYERQIWLIKERTK